MNHFKVAKEEMSHYGTEITSIQNLLAILIGPTATPSVTGELAGLGVAKLSDLSIEELKQFEGVGEASALRIASAFSLAYHMNRYKRERGYIVRSPEDAYDYLKDIAHLKHETFVALYLNAKCEVIHRKEIFKGSLNATVVHPREIFKEGVRLSAASIMVSHNHPSGDPAPSREDIDVTRRLLEAGKIVGIELLDHIIIGDGRYVSLREHGSI